MNKSHFAEMLFTLYDRLSHLQIHDFICWNLELRENKNRIGLILLPIDGGLTQQGVREFIQSI